MIRKINYILLLLMISLSVLAQKKDISTARQYVKAGNNLDKAEQMMTNLLKDSANRGNTKIWMTLFDAVKKQYDLGNEKLYLKQPYDTASLFIANRKMYTVLMGLDTIDAQSAKKGKGDFEYRKRSASILNTYRPNLYNGGIFFIHKGQYDKAYDCLDTYISMADHPMFSKYNYAENDKRIPEAAYWAVYCGYKMKNSKATLHHTYLALKDTAHYNLMLQYLAETYKMENDTVRYIKTLEEGFKLYPHFSFFFPRLIEFYSHNGNTRKALAICNDALALDTANTVYRFAKSTLLLNMGRYDECIDVCDQLIAENDSLADVYLNAGLAYYNQGVSIDKQSLKSKKQRSAMLDFYTKAMPYLQRYKVLAPDQKEKWLSPLYTIYLNLNMGREFDEINKLMMEQDTKDNNQQEKKK